MMESALKGSDSRQLKQRVIRQKNDGECNEGECLREESRRWHEKDAGASFDQGLEKCASKWKARGNRHIYSIALLVCVGLSLNSEKYGLGGKISKIKKHLRENHRNTVAKLESQMASPRFGSFVSDGLAEAGDEDMPTKVITELPRSVRFDLRGDESAATLVETFIRHCQQSVDPEYHARNSPLHMISRWQREPACRMLAEHPILMNAARTMMGLSPEAPLYLYEVQQKVKKAGDVHRLHSDMESSSPECGENDAATLWLMLKSDCPDEQSPVTLVEGSQKIHNAHQEIINRKCWGAGNRDLPCDVDKILQEVEMANDNVKVVSGPSQPLMGITWPTTAWHMTRDKCARRAAIIKYTASKSCARSLAFHCPKPSFAEFTDHPDRPPFIQVGAHSEEDVAEVNYPLDFLHRLPSTTEPKSRCTKTNPPSKDLIKGSLTVDDSIHLSEDYYEGGVMVPIGSSKYPKEPTIKSSSFFIQAMKTFYDSNKRQFLAHKPHTQDTLEICAVIKGQINYAISPSCDEYYDVISVKEGHVVVLLPGIFHTSAPDKDINGEQICFKVSPIKSGGGFKDNTAAVNASREATQSLTENLESYFSSKRTLKIFDSTHVMRPPGFQKLVVKEVQYQEHEQRQSDGDEHDLIILTISGSLTIKSGGSTIMLPEHQHAFVPAGVEHGFEAQDGPARMLFIEMR